MTTSSHQKHTMRKLPEHSKARRRLFSEDCVNDQASIDNFANILQETCKRDKENMKEKWNFNFDTERAMEGSFEWYEKVDDTWQCMEPEPKIVDNFDNSSDIMTSFDKDDEAKFLPVMENEITPKNRTDDKVPLLRKRKREASLNENGVKRKLFD